MWRQLILSFPKQHPCGQKGEPEEAGDFSRRPLIVQNEPLAMSEIYDLLKKSLYYTATLSLMSNTDINPHFFNMELGGPYLTISVSF